VRAPHDDIAPPSFPRELAWANVAMLSMEQQAARPVLVDFLDVMRPQSVRVLPYVQAWHDRYGDGGLRVISVHTPGFAPSRDEGLVRAEVERLGIEHAVALDLDGAVWASYDNRGWPARYLFRRGLRLFDFHLGEGGYAETEAAIRECLGLEPAEPVPPVRPEDAPDALLVVPTPEQPGAYCGPYEAGEVWVVASGAGELEVDGERYAVERPGAHLLRRHEVSAQGVLDLAPGPGVTVHATVFSAGLAPAQDR
jgi:hypothetical protein